MIAKDARRAREIARALVLEVGGQGATAKLVGIKQPSVAGWIKNGIGSTRENDLRFRFPELKVWSRFPPRSEAN